MLQIKVKRVESDIDLSQLAKEYAKIFLSTMLQNVTQNKEGGTNGESFRELAREM